MLTIKERFAHTLGCKPEYIQIRLVVLGHGEVCGRCGGGGHYSFNLMHGTTCFGCNGNGKAVRKLTAALLKTVAAQVAAGELLPYLAKIKATAQRKTKVRGFVDRLFVYWGQNPTIHAEKGLHWTQCSERQHEINAFCCPLSQEATELVRLVEKGEWSKDCRDYVPVSDERQDTALVRLTEIINLVKNAETLAPAKVATVSA